MLTTWEQRVRRDGIKLTKVSIPVPPKSTSVISPIACERASRRERRS